MSLARHNKAVDIKVVLMHYQVMNKRILVLVLSFAALLGYGYALGGLGAYMMGRGRPFVIAAGLTGGTFCVWLALKLWRGYLDDIEDDIRKEDSAGADKDRSESQKSRSGGRAGEGPNR